MFSTRKGVPDYYERSRDFQVFLKLLDVILNACYADTEYFTNLISPTHCKARLLPYLSHYVGYTYDYEEPVKMNRTITKNWPTLKRNRGSAVGFNLAISLAMSQIEDLDSADILKLFNISFDTETDFYGRQRHVINIYMYHQAYLSKLYDLIEAVRPAGTVVRIIPADSIAASETIVLTDEFKFLRYDYATSKLLYIGDIPIYIQNSWEIMENGQSTGEYLVDGEFYDMYHNSLGRKLDSQQRIYNSHTQEMTGEIIKAPYIYKIVDKLPEGEKETRNNVYEDRIVDAQGNVTVVKKFLVPTGKYFNLEHAARVLNTCYEIKCGGEFTGYFISADSWKIQDATNSRTQFYLRNYILDGVVVKKVYGIENNTMYNWHIDPESGYFVKDNIGEDVNTFDDNIPWDEHSYMSKKRYIMNTTVSGMMYTTEYFVNKHEDIQDVAGNIILSKKDRYKVSDSSHVGFSEVHDASKATTYDKTWISARSRSYNDDKDYFNTYTKEDFNDYTVSSGYVDERIKILPSDFKLVTVVPNKPEEELTSTDKLTSVHREYDGTNNLDTISVASGTEVTGTRAKLKLECVDGNTQNKSDSYLELNVKLRNEDDLFSVFSLLELVFEDSDVGEKKHIFLRWKRAENADQFYNFNEMPEQIVFSEEGQILPRTLKFTAGDPIIISPKVYDGSCEVNSQFQLLDIDSEEEEE